MPKTHDILDDAFMQARTERCPLSYLVYRSICRTGHGPAPTRYPAATSQGCVSAQYHIRAAINAGNRALMQETDAGLTGVSPALAGCAGSTLFHRSVLEPAPAELRAGCAAPTVLPDHDLTQGQVEILWLRDRQELVNCDMGKAALLRYYEAQDRKLGD